ncbi:TIR domain-containing protein [Acetivibrio cellulolyticus]|uniref:TIR domain-containing protein n=1 Tax=Acetivibrio cellulolyticus TaxID=35830 RepID=UPI0001E2F064|nr:nucleotide-binding protein [Acetivibrio cellulolyticus]
MDYEGEYRGCYIHGCKERTDFDGIAYTISVLEKNNLNEYLFTETIRMTGTAIVIQFKRRDANSLAFENIKRVLISKVKARIDSGFFEHGERYVEDIRSKNVNEQCIELEDSKIKYYILKTLSNIRRSDSTTFKMYTFQILGFVNLFKCTNESLFFNLSLLHEEGFIDSDSEEITEKSKSYITSKGVSLFHEMEEKNKVKKDTKKEEGSQYMPDKTAVFVIHGRNDKIRKSMFDFLRSIGLKPIEWNQAITLTGKPSPYIGEILDAAFEHAQAIVSLFTPDDEAKLLPQYSYSDDKEYETNLTPQARPNVLFETGMAFGKDQNRTIIIEIGSLRPFSDIAGRHVVRLNDTPEKRKELATRLKLAGCEIDIDGTDWLSTGDFNIK